MKKVISIDGGGIRGIIPAYLLMCIEREMQDHLCNHVDLIAGTSTGAIVAAGASAGIPMENMLALYFEQGPDIFKKTWSTRWKSVFGLKGGKHDVHNFIKILENTYGGGSMDELLKTDFLSCAYSMTDGKPRFFSNRQEGNLPLGRVVAASAAAPTYFDPVTIEGKEYIDGGVFAGNPAMAAFAEIKSLNNGLPAEDILMISLGTGNRLKEYDSVKDWFKFKWVNPLLDILMASDGGVIHHQLVKIYQSVDESSNYYRITGKLPANISGDMGNAQLGNMDNILEFAKYLEKKNKKKICEIAEKLES
jgi:patatin-like phospholipase/acyl hydrolase